MLLDKIGKKDILLTILPTYLCSVLKIVNKSSIFLFIAYVLKCFPIIRVSTFSGFPAEVIHFSTTNFISFQFNPSNGEVGSSRLLKVCSINLFIHIC